MPFGAPNLDPPYKLTRQPLSGGGTGWEAELDEAPFGPGKTIDSNYYQPAVRAGAPSEELFCYPIEVASGTVGDVQTIEVDTADPTWQEAVDPPASNPCNEPVAIALATWSPLGLTFGYFPEPNYELAKFAPGTFCGYLWETEATAPAERLISKVVNSPQIVCHDPVENERLWVRQGWAEYPDLYELYSTLLVHANRLLCWVQRWTMDPVAYDFPSTTTVAKFTEFVGLGAFTAGAFTSFLRQHTFREYCVPGPSDGAQRVPLIGPGIVTGVVVKNTAETVTYLAGTDYDLELTTGWVKRRSGGGITAGQTVRIYQDGTAVEGYKQPAIVTGSVDGSWVLPKLDEFEAALLVKADASRDFAIPNKLQQGFLTLDTATGESVAENLVDLMTVDPDDAYAVITGWRVITVHESKAAGVFLASMQITNAEMESQLGADELFYFLSGPMTRNIDPAAPLVSWDVQDTGSASLTLGAGYNPNTIDMWRMGLAYTYEMRDVELSKKAPFDPLLVAAANGKIVTNAGGTTPVQPDYHTDLGSNPL